LRDNGGSRCEGCTHKITSPIQLGTEILKSEEKEIVVEEESGTKVTYDIPDLPSGYFRGKHGGIYTNIKVEDEDVEVLVYQHDLYIYDRQHDPALGDIIWFRLHLPRGDIREFSIPQSEVVSRDKFRDKVAAMGVTCHTIKQLEGLQVYALRMVDTLQIKEKAKVLLSQMGWTPANTFIIGAREYRKDSVYQNPVSSTMRDLSEAMRVVGSLEEWQDTVSLYNQPGMEVYAFALAASFGSPLMRFSGVSSGILNFYSRASGTGKSTILEAINSVYGNPKGMMETQIDTAMHKLHRMGMLNNLPMTIDEITNMAPEVMSDFVYTTTQGRGRNRMEARANIERVNNTTWNNIVITTANTHLGDRLRTIKADPQGELMRLIDFRMAKPSNIEALNAVEHFQRLHTNYGHAGDLYLRYLVPSLEDAAKNFAAMRVKMYDTFKFTVPERYHAGSITSAFAGAATANMLGITRFPIPRMLDWLVENYRGDNKMVLSKHDADSILNGYVLEHSNNVLVAEDAARKGNLPVAPDSLPKGALLIRIEPDTGDVYLLSAPFIRWAGQRGINVQEFGEDYTKETGQTVELIKKRMGKGTPMDIGSVRAYRFPQAKFKLNIPLKPETGGDDVPSEA
jgi:hypothetical protein